MWDIKHILHLLTWLGFFTATLCVTVSADKAKIGISPEEYQKSCDLGDVQSCFDLGILHYTANGVDRNPGLAAKLYIRACEGKFLKACLELSRMYIQGLGVSKSEGEYFKYRKKACKIGHSISCNLLGQKLVALGILYIRGSIENGEDKAIARFQEACELGYKPGCQRRRDLLGRKLVALGDRYIRGDLEYDESKAATQFHEACEIGYKKGCQRDRALDGFDKLISIEDQNSEKTTAILNPIGNVLDFSTSSKNQRFLRCLAFFSSRAKWLKFQQLPQIPNSRNQIGLQVMIAASYLTSYMIHKKNSKKSKVTLLAVLTEASPNTNWYLSRYRYNFLHGSHPWKSDRFLKNDHRKCRQLLAKTRRLLGKGKLLETLELNLLP